MPQQPKATLAKTASATLGRDITQKTHHSHKHCKGRHAPQSSTTKTDDYSKAMKRTTSSIHRNIEEVMAARLIHDGGRLSILPAPTNVHEYAKGGAKQNTKNHLVSSSINAARRSRMKKDAAISGIAAGSDNKSSSVLNQAPKTKKITKADRHRQQLLEAAEAEERAKTQATSTSTSTSTSVSAPSSTPSPAPTSTATSKRKRKSAPSITLEGEALKREKKRLKYIREMQGEVVSSSEEEEEDEDGEDEEDDNDEDQDDADEEKENHKDNIKPKKDSADSVHAASTSSSTTTTSSSSSSSSSTSPSSSSSSSSSTPSASKR